jgi:hypothetical protein
MPRKELSLMNTVDPGFAIVIGLGERLGSH